MNTKIIAGAGVSIAIMIGVIALLAAFGEHTKTNEDSVTHLLVLVASSGGGFVSGLIFAATARSEARTISDVFLRLLKAKALHQGS